MGKFPSEQVIVSLLREEKSIKNVLHRLGKNYDRCEKLKQLSERYGIKLVKQNICCTSDRKEDMRLKNFYKDDYHIGYTFKKQGYMWTIFAITNGNKKLYHCENEKGFKSSFHALDIK